MAPPNPIAIMLSGPSRKYTETLKKIKIEAVSKIWTGSFFIFCGMFGEISFNSLSCDLFFLTSNKVFKQSSWYQSFLSLVDFSSSWIFTWHNEHLDKLEFGTTDSVFCTLVLFLISIVSNSKIFFKYFLSDSKSGLFSLILLIRYWFLPLSPLLLLMASLSFEIICFLSNFNNPIKMFLFLNVNPLRKFSILSNILII